MKVVFLQDVPDVASAGEVKEVADGYARNFLIPRKMAALASPQALSQVVTIEKVEGKTNEELIELAGQLEGKEVNLKAHAGAKERLYGSITSADIAAELESVTGLVVDKRKIELEKPIHQLGSYELTVKLGKDITPKITVNVTEAEAKEEPPKKAKKAAKKTTKAEKKKPEKTEEKPKATKKKATKATKEKKATPKKKTTTKAKTTKKKEEK